MTETFFFPWYARVAVILVGDIIPGCLDPEGNLIKRDFVHRFFTVTLPQSGPISLLFWLDRVITIGGIQSITEQPVQMITAIFILTVGVAVIFDTTRWGVACVFHAISLKDAAAVIGPRDFYAKARSQS